MSIIKTALVAASLVAAAAAANAQGREDLNSGFHGNTPAVQSYPVQSFNGPARAVISQDARGAYARAGAARARPQAEWYDANPLFDSFHGN